jgi:hypothetical protein
MDGVRARIARFVKHLLGFDDLVDLRLRRMRVGVDNIDARGAQAGDDEEASPEEGVAGERGERGAAGVPAEMVELVSLVGHRHRMDDRAARCRAGRDVDDAQRVGLGEIRRQHENIGEVLGWSLHRELRRGIECRIGTHCLKHRCSSGNQLAHTCHCRHPTSLHRLDLYWMPTVAVYCHHTRRGCHRLE